MRAELCHEAMRLAGMILQHPLGATPVSYALAAMMCLHAARLPARIDAAGNLATLFERDRSRWDYALVGEGMKLLELSAAGSDLSEYHVEAAIAAVHASAGCAEATDWRAIVSLYDTLLSLRHSPIVALNRAIAVAQYEGPARGLAELRAIGDAERLASYPFHAAALGEFEFQLGRTAAARTQFETARALARNPMERQFFERRVAACCATATPGA